MDRKELFVFSGRIEEGRQRREKSVDQQIPAGVVAEITVIPMRAAADDYHAETRDSLTAQSVIALSYSGISFSTIV